MGEEEGNFGVFVNCIGKDEDTPIILQMINELTGTPAVSGEDLAGGASVKWKVDNKYYSAEVSFAVCSGENVSKELARTDREYEALVLLCDMDNHKACERLSQTWAQVESPDNEGGAPAISLVVGATKGVESSNYDAMLSWCVKHGCELIEWKRDGAQAAEEQENDSDSSSDDGYPAEAVGVARLAEALQAHTWSHMTMKRDPTLRPRRDEEPETNTTKEGPSDETGASKESNGCGQGGVSECSGGSELPGLKELEEKAMAPSSATREEVKKKLDSLLSAEEEQLIASGLQDGGNDDKDPGGESFENLFGRLAQMKMHAESLPHEERKAYAEQVVMAFWNAIGGDEEEVKLEEND